MTVSIPTANIAFMFGREAATKLFIKGSTFTNLVEELKDSGEGFVFSTQGNPNFISLEHTVNIGKSFELTLSLIDPTGEFEKQFLTSNVLEVMANSYPNDGSRFYSGNWKGTEAQRNLRGVQQNLELLTSLSSFDIEYLKNTKRRNIYLAYGIGDQLSLWAGPFKVYIQTIDIKIDGPRILTFRFVATENHLDPKENLNAFGKPAIIDNKGVAISCDGRSRPIFLQDPANIYNPYNLTLTSPVDVHAILVDVIRSYIRNATSHKNVIVLLPDLNKICSKAIDVAINISRYDKSSLAGLGSLIGGQQAATALTVSPETEPLARCEIFLNELFGELGIELVAIDKNGNNAIATAIPPSNSNQLLNASSFSNKINASDTYKTYFSDTTFFARLKNVRDRGTPKHSDLMNSFIEKLNEVNTGRYSITHEILSENNLLILDLWKNDSTLNCDNYLLFTDGEIEDSEEFVIFGDINLIREYLYGSDTNNTLGRYLYPKDAEILLNPLYKEKVTQLTKFNKSEITYPFGDQSYIPDEFAYFQDDTSTSGNESFASLLGKENFDLITKLKAPVFRYNTKNPNITELNIKESNQYWSQLLTHFEAVVHRKASGIIGGIIPSEYSTLKPKSITDLVLYATEAGVFNEGLSEKRKNEILAEIRKIIESQDFGSEDKNSVMVAVYLMINYLSKECNIGLRRLFKQQYASDPSMLVNNFLNQVYNQVYQVNIQTLPMFNLSNIINLTRPCIFLMQNVNMPMIRQPDPSILSIVYSGLYRILGFRHSIDFNGCYSEFFLQKIITVKNTKTKNENTDMSTSAVVSPTLVSGPINNAGAGVGTYPVPGKVDTRRFLTLKEPSFHPYFIKTYNIK